MKLWVDAERQPEPDWVWAKMPCSAIVFLQSGLVEQISFAPDQRKLVGDVVEWMISHNVHPRVHEIHKRSSGVLTRMLISKVAEIAS
jgi:hypothetical protein